MLRQRILTALVLAAVAILGVLWLPSGVLMLLVAGIVALGAREWLQLIGMPGHGARIAFHGAWLVLLLLGWLGGETGFGLLLVLLAALFWLLPVPLWLRRYAAEPALAQPREWWVISGLVVLAGGGVAFTVLHDAPGYGPGWVLLLMFLVAGADIGAFFAGRRFGRVKLAPQISPGKTREGAWGALAATALVALAGAAALGVPAARWPAFLLVCALTVIWSILGDLFESMLKRQHGAKDSGTLLPGHGGVLDRIDSLTAAAPVFLLGLTVFGPWR